LERCVLVAIILFKFVFDWVTYDNGLKKGIDLKQKETIEDSIINQRLVEKKNLVLQIDSLEKIKSMLRSSNRPSGNDSIKY